MLTDESPTSANLGNDHVPFGEAQSKAMRACARSGQYHTIVESRVHLTWYQSHALNLVVSTDW